MPYLSIVPPLYDARRPRGVLDHAGDVDCTPHIHKHLRLALYGGQGD